jgi:uncharacterized protein YjbJ (UPF0337 family)
MKPRTRNIAKGTGREIKGRIKEAAGALTGNKRLKAEGKLQGAAGRAQKKLGKAEKELEEDLEREDV